MRVMQGGGFVRHRGLGARAMVAGPHPIGGMRDKQQKQGRIAMNATQIEVVQRTFALAAPLAEEIAACFYQRLFVLDPTLRALFPPTLKAQGDKLMSVLALVVRGLHQPETL